MTNQGPKQQTHSQRQQNHGPRMGSSHIHRVGEYPFHQPNLRRRLIMLSRHGGCLPYPMYPCADPDRFIRGGPSFLVFWVFFFFTFFS